MKLANPESAFLSKRLHILTAFVCGASLSLDWPLLAQQSPALAQSQVVTGAGNGPAQAAPKIPNDQLDSLVAPIALYPDPLLAQTLAASTYPLEIVELDEWLAKNPNLKDKALADAVAKQPWDPSVQSMAVFPTVVKQMSDDVAWSSDLGNAYLAQPADVMAAVQRMRAKAQGKGNLKTSVQQKVDTETVEGQEVIEIQQADPEVVYVPSYNPTVVYGDAVYPYPLIDYPPIGYYAAGGALAFGAGVVMGAAWGGGWWGNCDWHGGGDININNKNNFNKNNFSNKNTGSGKWQHNPQHRGGAPYGDRGTANKYGGRARQQPIGGANRSGGATGLGARSAVSSASGYRPGGGGAGNVGAGKRPGGFGAAAGERNIGAGNRGGGTGMGNRSGGISSSFREDGPDRIGNRDISSGVSSGSRGFSSSSFSGEAFGGGSGSFSRASSNRGGYSMGGGGFSGGGFRGGGGRGGGGGRRR